MEFQFIDDDQVVLVDDMPNFMKIGGKLFFTPLLFSFLAAVEILNTLPGQAADDIVWSALDKIGSKIKKNDPYAYNDSLIGVFDNKPVRIVDTQLPPQWVCRADLSVKDEKAEVDIKAAKVRDDHFYRACIDLAFENARNGVDEKWNKGALVCTGVWLFVWHLSRAQSKGGDLNRNYEVAVSSAAQIMKELD